LSQHASPYKKEGIMTSQTCTPRTFCCIRKILFAGGFWFLSGLLAAPAEAAIVTFEDVGQALADNSFFNGGPTTNNDPWISGGVEFENMFTDFGGGFTGWEGWAYSNVQDLVTAGFTNQYAVYSPSGTAAGFGSGNSRTYALAFPGSVKDGNASVLSFGALSQVHAVDLANTTYTLLALRDGNDGGANFVSQYQDGDFLRLHITGFDGPGATGNATGSVAFDLANFGGAGAEDDFVLNDWTTLDLSLLGQVQSLRFSLDSNVIDTFGGVDFLNTPAYVAVDNLSFSVVPEPASPLAIAAVLTCGVISRRRGRQRTGPRP
jgi:hypothetical protein